MIKIESIIKSALKLLLGISMLKCFLLIMNLYLASSLNKSEFGIFSIIRTSSASIVAIIAYPISIAIIAEINRKKEINISGKIYDIIKLVVIISAIIIFIFIIFKNQIISNIYNSKIGNYEYIQILLLFLFSFIVTCMVGIFVALEDLKYLILSNLYSVILILIILGTTKHIIVNDYRYYINIIVLFYLFICSIQILFLQKKYKIIRFTVKNKEISYKKFLSFSVPIFLMTLINNLYPQLIKIKIFNEDESILGSFTLAEQWQILSMNVVSFFVLPIMNKSGDKDYKTIFNQFTKVTFKVSLGMLFFGMLTFSLYSHFFYKSNYEFKFVVFILLLSCIPSSMLLLYDRIMVAKNASKYVLKVYFTIGLLTLIFVNFCHNNLLFVSLSILFGKIIGYIYIKIIYTKLEL